MRLHLSIAGAVIVVLIIGFLLWSIIPLLISAPEFASTKIYDRNGGLLYQVSDSEQGKRSPVAFETMPVSLTNALIASEDQRFFKHHGVDWLALARTIRNRLTGRQQRGGASTIEQQLIKIKFFPSATRSPLQKAREMTAATFWAFTHSKEQTLQDYLNTAYFGNHAYGIAAAADIYFHKPVGELSAAESALLVGILPAPSEYDPMRHFDRAQTRFDYVLDRLIATGKLTEQDRDNISSKDIVFFPYQSTISAPHFVFAVLDELESTIPDIATGGYAVRTTLDPDLQRAAEQSVLNRITGLKKQNVGNAAVVALDPRTGDELAYVGSAGYFNESISGAIDMAQAKRQPGSALKPFLYFRSFMLGFTPATIIADTPIRYTTATGGAYYPRNYNYRYFGPVSIRDALGSSLNIPAVKVLDSIGLLEFFTTMQRFGITFPQPPDYYGLSVVLGGGEVTLVDTAHAYASLANYGYSVPVRNVLEIRDRDNNIVFSAENPSRHPLFEDQGKAEQAAALIANILSDKTARSRSFGEVNQLDLGKAIAAKTGTTRDFHDNWAFGYTPEFVVGVWVGNADNSPMEGVSGITGAVPIYNDIMRNRYDKQPAIVWPQPDGLVSRDICVTSGLLATPLCQKTRKEWFMAGTEPTQPDTWYRQVDIDAKTGLLATAACQQHVLSKTYLVAPPEYASWVAASGFEQPPQQDCTGKTLTEDIDPVILSPLDGDVFEISSLVDKANQSIPFVAGGGQTPYDWTINGRNIESANAVYLWKPEPGTFTLSLGHSQITFTVR